MSETGSRARRAYTRSDYWQRAQDARATRMWALNHPKPKLFLSSTGKIRKTARALLEAQARCDLQRVADLIRELPEDVLGMALDLIAEARSANGGVFR